MRIIFRFILSLWFLIPVTETLAAPEDVEGWLDTRWDMTPEELDERNIEGLEQKKRDDGKYEYVIEKYSVFGTNFKVLFFWKNERLVRVQLSSNLLHSKPSSAYNPMFHTPRRELSTRIAQSLIRKYGKPDTQNLKDEADIENKYQKMFPEDDIRVGTYQRKMDWIFNSTLIKLEHNYLNHYSLSGENDPASVDSFNITYEKNETKDKL